MQNPFEDLIPQGKSDQSSQDKNPFLDLIPEKSASVEKKAPKKRDFIDQINYLGDSAGKGLRHAISAPAQFINPFIDKIAGTNLTDSLNSGNNALDEAYARKYPDAGFVGESVSNIGEYLPSMFVGGGVMKGASLGGKGISGAAKGLSSLVGRGAGAGIASSPLIYDQTGEESPLTKAALGGLTGAVAAPVLVGGGKIAQLAGKGIGKAKSFISNPKSLVKDQVLGDITEIPETLSRKEAGERLGVNLRPSEASQNTLTAATEADLGYSKEGAKFLENQAKIRQAEEKGAIDSLLNEITPDSENKNVSSSIRDIAQGIQGARENAILSNDKKIIDSFLGKLSPADHSDVGSSIRETAQNILQKKRNELSQTASPIYEVAYKENVAPEKIRELMKQDGTIEKSINDVIKNPDYRAELEGYSPNSIKVLDLAKRQIDSRISAAKQVEDREQVRILQKAKERLVNETDKYSPAYAKARAIYGEGAKPIVDLENGSIGTLSKLDDKELNKATRVLFNPQETNLQVLSKARDEITKESPELWKSMIRSEMERRLDRSSNQVSGENFYKQIFGKSVDYKQFKEAVKGFPDLQKELEGLRDQFKNSSHTMKAVRGTDIAKISRMNDSQLKNVSKTIFDPTQTDQKSFAQVRDAFEKENPQVWANLTRNEIERLMLSVKNKRYGSTFYSAVLENDNRYNQFLEATKSNPEARKKLEDMREVFGSLINMKNAREAYNKRANKLDLGRSTASTVMNMTKKLVAGDYDKAALNIIFDKNWDKSLSNIRKIKNKNARMERILGLLKATAGAMPSVVQYGMK